MERRITISKFRNLGFDEPTHLTINKSLKEGEIGDLIIIIGQNNSGKSNVLNALETIPSLQFAEKDVTTLSFDSKDLIPEIRFEVWDQDHEGSLIIKKGSQPQYNFIAKRPGVGPSETELRSSLIQLIQDAREAGFNVDGLESYLSEDNISNNLPHISTSIAGLRLVSNNYNLSSILSNFKRTHSDNLILQLVSQASNNKADQADIYFMKNYGIHFIPQIIRYKERPITSQRLTTSSQSLSSNAFFTSVFEAIGIEAVSIINAYNQFNKYHNIAILNKIKHDVDSKIKQLNDEFNRLYFSSNDPYLFTLNLDSTSINFGMARGINEDPIMLDHQSTGFKWFFDFFFNFLYANALNPGDIVLMDEPATNLHPQGQEELRRFMKEFAIRNGITFIIATHSPFLINHDYFDELRVVSMKNNKAKIDNLFTAVNPDDPDSLMPIKESLTIRQNVLYDYETEVVWVEGITDYNYLTLFKKLLDIQNIAFIPFQGVGADDAEQEKVLAKLSSIKFYKKMILLDGDKAGKAFKDKCQGTCFKDRCVCISDLNTDKAKFKEIEDLFSAEDQKKYGSLNAETADFKKAHASSTMKKTCQLSDFTTETVENFKALFKLLIE